MTLLPLAGGPSDSRGGLLQAPLSISTQPPAARCRRPGPCLFVSPLTEGSYLVHGRTPPQKQPAFSHRMV